MPAVFSLDNSTVASNAYFLYNDSNINITPNYWYRFENESLTTDSGTDNIILTNSGGTNANVSVRGNNCLSLNGTNQYLNGTINGISNNSFSFSIWSYVKNLAYNTIISIGANNQTLNNILSIFSFNFGSNFKYGFSFWLNDCVTVLDFNDINTWVYLTFTYNNITKERCIYRNGIKLELTAAFSTSGNFTGTNYLCVGVFISGVNWFNGYLDDLRIYTNKILTQNEIIKIYNGTKSYESGYNNTAITSNVLINTLSTKQDLYTSENQYPSRIYDSSSAIVPITILEQSAYSSSFTLNNNGITNDYGTYYLYYSTYHSSYPPYNLFNYNFNEIGGHFGGNYNGTTGIYNGTNYIISGYTGDWIIIKLTRPIKLTKISFFITPGYYSRTPGLWKIYGSIDGINWEVINDASNILTIISSTYYTNNGGFYTKNNINTTKFYLYYGLVVNQLSGADYYLNFSEWKIYGIEKTSSQADWDYTIINKPDLTQYITSNVLSNQQFINSNFIQNSLSTDFIKAGNSNKFIVNDSYTNDITFKRNVFSSNIITSNLFVIDNYTVLNTSVYQTEQLQITNNATATALKVSQTTANQNVAEFYNSANPALVINSTGNIGIGTTNPSDKLQVNGNISIKDGNKLRVDGASGATAISIGGYGSLEIDASGIIGGRFIVKDSGNVGIGITNPTEKLQVNGNIYGKGAFLFKEDRGITDSRNWCIRQNNSYEGAFQIGCTDTNTGSIPDMNTTPSFAKFTILNNGNIGIGTHNPSKKLTVVGQADFSGSTNGFANPLIKITQNAAWDGNYALQISGYTDLGGIRINGGDLGNSIFKVSAGTMGLTTYNGDILFNTNNGNEKMRILNAGNIGIGKTNPGYTLDVAGIINASNIYINGNPFTGGGGSSQWTTSNTNIYYNVGNVGIGTVVPTNLLHLHKNSANAYNAIQLTDSTTGISSNSGFIISKESNQDVKIMNCFNANMIFGTSNTEQLRITSNGYIGIGNSNPSYNLDVIGTIKTNSLFVNYTNIAYPPKQCTSFSAVSTTTLLTKSFNLQSIVLDNTNILSGSGTYNIYTNSYHPGYSVNTLFNYSYSTYGGVTNSFAWASGVWTNGIYNNTLSTNTIDNLYYGDVIIVQLPVSIALSSYDIWAIKGNDEEKGRAPGEWKVYGSTNGINFFELSNASHTSTRLTINSYTGSEFKYTKTIIGNSLSYSWYGICVNKLAGTSGLLHMRELRFYANDNLSTIVKNGNVGIGNTNPKVKLQITNGAVGISGNANQGAIITGFNTAPGSLTIGDIQTRYGNKVMINKSIPTSDFIPTITINSSTNLLTNILNTQDYYYSFINTGANTLNIPVNITCDILIIGGGGSGGCRHGGGGGAGALIYLQNQVLTSGTYTVNIGAGGTTTGTTASPGNNGNDTYITLNGSDVYRAKGGGGGAGSSTGAGIAGGSSGGSGAGYQNFSAAPLINNIPSGTFGNYGGKGCFTSVGPAGYAGGGGGGAGTVGYDGSQSGYPASAGNGGNGKLININGVSVYYAGGGGGGCAASSTSAGTGGLGGGGAGSKSNATAISGTANTGSGGGGSGFDDGANNGASGAGGSGIVIIRFKFDNFLINNTAGLLMECVDNTEIAVYNNGSSLNSLIYYDNSNTTIGRDMGWGSPSNLNLIGCNVNLSGNVNINNKTSGTCLKVIQSSVSQNLAEFYNSSNLALVINNTGTVGINTTIPNTNYKLDVNGIINATDISKNGISITSLISNSAVLNNVIVDVSYCNSFLANTFYNNSNSTNIYFNNDTLNNIGISKNNYYAVSFSNGNASVQNVSSFPILYNSNLNIINPIVWYKFNSNNFLNDYGSSNYGSLTSFNNTTYSTINKYRGTASASFTASASNYLTMPITTNLYSIQTTTGITFSVWAKINTNTGIWGRIFDFGYNLTGSSIILMSRRALTDTINFSNQNNYYTTNSYVDNNWHHYVFTISKTGQWIIYIDGVLASFTTALPTATNLPNYSIAIAYFGKSGVAGDGYLDGNISDFRIYNLDLTATQAAILYKNTNIYTDYSYSIVKDLNNNLIYPTLWYKFENNLLDSSGNDNHLILYAGNYNFSSTIVSKGNYSIKPNPTVTLTSTNNITIDNTNTNITIAFWFNVYGLNLIYDTLIFSPVFGLQNLCITRADTNKLNFRFAGSAWFRTTTDYYLNDNKWYHLTMVGEKIGAATRISLYINGVFKENNGAGGTGTWASFSEQLGVFTNNEINCAYAYLDDLRVYVGTVLTNNQIQELYNGSVNFYHTPKTLNYTDTTTSYTGALSISGNSISNGALMAGYNTISGALTIGDINTRYGGKSIINKTLTNINNIPTITINSSANLLTNIQNTQDYYYSFTSTGLNNLILSSKVNCDILIVGGGGSGGCRTGGGGGAGALIYLQNQTLTAGTYSVYVGLGGTAVGGSTGINGINGGDSYIQNSLSADIYRAKGGGGGANPNIGLAGGSSGGSCGGYVFLSQDPLTTNVPVGIYGNYGGKGSTQVSTEISYDAGGGGGAGSPGGNGIPTGKCGNGGNGLLININGINTYYAGGGGGGGGSGTTAGTGGLGGGGAGTAGPNTAISGIANTGSGGGGSGYTGSTNGTSGAGGSGIIIIRFKFDKNLANNTAGLLLECADNTEIAVYNKGSNINSLIYYDNSNTTIGRDMGWGNPLNINLIGNNINFNGYTKTSNIEFDYLFSRIDRSYPPKAWNLATPETTTTFLGKLCYKQTLTLTSDNITYGSGNYIVYSSTTFGSFFKELLFNYITLTDTGGVWAASSYTNGVYTGANTIDGTYFGEWLVIKLPKPIILKSYIFWTRNSYNFLSPGEWKFYGSSDGVSFVEIVDASQTTKIVSASYNGTSYTKNILNYNTQFLYYGFCVNKLTGTDSTSYNLSFTEFRLYGEEATINNTDTPLKITNDLSIGEISNNSEIRQYPPKAYTSLSSVSTVTFLGQTTITLQTITLDTANIAYGSGIYSLYMSSVFSSATQPNNAFDFLSGVNNSGMIFSNNYDQTTGYYNLTTRYINSLYKGEWFVIKLPVSIILKQYSIFIRSAAIWRAPGEWKVYGSIDGANFIEITDANQLTQLTESSYNINTNAYFKNVKNQTTYYNYFGFCFNKIVGGAGGGGGGGAGGGGDGYLEITEIQLFGSEYPSESYALTVKPNNITTNVNVGIGTIAPANLLHLHKNTSNAYIAIQLTDNTTGITSNSGFIISKESNQDVKIMNCFNANMIFGTSNTEDMRITNNGFVSIDNNNPYINFNVGSNNKNHKIGRAIINATGLHNADKQDSLQIGRWDDSISSVLANGLDPVFTGLKYNVTPGNYTNISFHTWGNSIANSREVMRINHYGYLGINNTNPQCHLDVSGSINATTDIKINNVSLSSTYITSNVLGQQNFINSNFIQNSLSTDFIKAGNSNKFIVNDKYTNDITFTKNIFSSNIITSNLFVIDNYTVLNTSVYQTEQLQITNSATATALKVSQTTANQNVAEFYNSANPALVIGSTGNIGIGTTNTSTYTLDINGNCRINTTTGYLFAGGLRLAGWDTGNCIWQQTGNLGISVNTGNSITFSVGNGIEKIRIDQNGNIGIGKTNPQFKLDIPTVDSISTPTNVLSFKNTADYGIYATSISTTSRGNSLDFLSKDYNSGTITTRNVLSLKVTGNVGIGTNAPTNLLHLHQNVPTTYNAIQLTDNTTGVSTTNGFIISKETNQDAKIMNCYNANMIFGTSNTETMRIINNGNIGIGITNPLTRLSVKGAVTINNGTQYVGTNNYMKSGSLTIGDITENYGTGGNNWSTNTAGLMLECLANTEIMVHDSGTRLMSLIQYNGDSVNTIVYGRSMNWGYPIGHYFNAQDVFNVYLNGASASWNNFYIRPTSLWGDAITTASETAGTKYITIGSMMYQNPHIVPSTVGGDALMRFGRAGGISTGTWWELATKTNGNFNIGKEASTTIGVCINPSGNVGIGTSTPTSKLTIRSGYGDGENSGLCLDASDISNLYNLKLYSFVQAGGQVGYYFKVNNVSSSVNALTFGYSGNIGIGISLPGYKLDVAGKVNANGLILDGSLTTGTISKTSGTMDIKTEASTAITFTQNTSEIMRIHTNSYIGIGTNAPSGLLHLYSTTAAQARLILAGTEFYPGGTTSTEGIAFLCGVNRSGNRQLWIADSAALASSTTNSTLMIVTQPGIVFISSRATDGSTQLPLDICDAIKINANKNVGIGTTTPNYKLDVNGIINATDIYKNGSSFSSSQWTTSNANIYYNVGNIGIGTIVPTNILHLHKNTSNAYNAIQLTDSITGITSNSGFIISKESNQDVKIMNCFSNANMIFGTSNTEQLKILNDGTLIQGNSINNYGGKYTSIINKTIQIDSFIIENFNTVVTKIGTTNEYYYKFTNTTVNLIISNEINCDILVIGGGGGGNGIAGGGAGACIYKTNILLMPGTYNINIGRGGNYYGENGLDTTIIYNSQTIYLAKGGGGGGGNSGGSCGGSLNLQNPVLTNNIPSGSYGNLGGIGAYYISNDADEYYAHGGGGGAGGIGGNGYNSQNYVFVGGNGGVGSNINITGEYIYYAGGGGGRGYDSFSYVNPGAGGAGGGGYGNDNGTPNTGGGGGAGGYGGSGIVIIRFKPPYYIIENNTGLILKCNNKTEIAINNNNKYASLLYYDSNNISIGRDMGWCNINNLNILSKYNYFSGNIGIGITTPTNILHLHKNTSNAYNAIQLTDNTTGTTSNSGFIISKESNQDVKIMNCFSNGNMIFGTSNTEDMRILNNGNIGIGKTNPNYRLDVAGIINASNYYINGSNFTGGGSSQWITSSTNIYYNAGNVGIGTTSPNCKLDVLGAVNIRGSSIYAPLNSYNNTAGCLTIGDTATNFGGSGWQTTMGLLLECANNTEITIHDDATRLASVVYYTGGATPSLTFGRAMATYGTTPCTFPSTCTFSVSPTFSAGFTSSANSSIAGSLALTGANPGLYWNGVAALGYVTTAGGYSSSAAVSDLVLRSDASKKLILQSGSAAGAIVIDTNNNVGIGFTNPSYKLHVTAGKTVNSTAFAMKISGGVAIIDSGNYGTLLGLGSEDGNFSKCAIGHVRTGSYDRGDIVFLSRTIADTTTCDMTDERMRISSSGYIGIGTTTPSSLLHIKGTNTALTVMSQGGSGTTSQLNLTTYDNLTNAAGCSLIATDDGAYGSTFKINLKTTGANTNTQFTALHITNAGLVGIGNTAPIGTLTLGNSSVIGSDGSLVIGKCSAAGTYRHYKLGIDSSYDFIIGDFGINNTAGTWLKQFAVNYGAPANTFYINSTGKIGIGTNTQSNILQVGAGGRLRIANDANDYTLIGTNNTDGSTNTRIVLSGNTRSSYLGHIEYITTNTGSHMFKTGDTDERMRILSTGNVGIGTTTPLSKFTIRSPYSDGENSGLCLDATDGTVYNLKLYSFTPAGGQVGYKFKVNNSTSSVDALTFGYNGNIGIGTATPNYPLHVNGNINCSDLLINTTSLTTTLSTKQNTLTAATTLVGDGTAITNLNYNNLFNLPLRFNTLDNSNIYFNSGWVGIGTTNPSCIFQIGASGRLRIATNVNDYTIIGTTDVPNPLNTCIMISGNLRGFTDKGNIEYFATSNGSHIFNTTNTTIERMRITSDGNIGIGKTNPNYKLDVAGIINASNYYINGTNFSSSQWITSTSNIYYNVGNVGIGTYLPQTSLDIYSENYTKPLLVLDVSNSLTTSGMPRGIGNPLIKLGKKGYTTSSGDYYGIGFGYAPIAENKQCCEIGCIITNNGSSLLGDLVFSTQSVFSTSTPAIERMRITSEGSVGIGVTNPVGVSNLTVGGEIRCFNDIAAFYSDIRLKKITSNITNAVSIITNINAFKYTASDLAINIGLVKEKDKNKQFIGVSAQDVNKVLPEIVSIAPFDLTEDAYGNIISKSGENYLTLKYDKLTPILIEAVKELKKEILFNKINSCYNYIPNIYKFCTCISNIIKININISNILKINDKIKIISNEINVNYTVINIIDNNTFIIDNIINDNNVFVYGTYIENIQNLDNNYLLELINNTSDELYKIMNIFYNNISETKELHKLIENLTQRIKALENK